jgi:hypothetical protein
MLAPGVLMLVAFRLVVGVAIGAASFMAHLVKPEITFARESINLDEEKRRVYKGASARASYRNSTHADLTGPETLDILPRNRMRRGSVNGQLTRKG